MKIKEKLDWILDKFVDGEWVMKEGWYKQNIDFVHSLGLKCDCVGWCTIDLSDPRTEEILVAIQRFCNENGWKPRGYYRRSYLDIESDWYELVADWIKEATCASLEKADSDSDVPVNDLTIRAYHETRVRPKDAWGIIVPERLRDACIRNNIEGLDFCWVRDVGRYEAEQYFHLYADRRITRIACDKNSAMANPELAEALGGYLPRLTELFYDLTIRLQDCYLADDMPEGGIAHAYSAATRSFIGRSKFLIHKSTAEILLREKALPAGALTPAMVVGDFPKGYTVEKTTRMVRHTKEHIAQSIRDYERCKSAPRPSRAVSEKDALKLVRCAKRERKEDFRKALAKANSAEVTESGYAPLLPYYLVTNGGFLSDEYELLSYCDAVRQNNYLHEELRAEELLEEKPRGVVFAKCPDGDRVLLCEDGTVIRFSHESPTATDDWKSLAQFFADALDE